MKTSKTKTKSLAEHEKFIISQALLEIKSVGDIPRVMNKVEGTAVKLNSFAWKTFVDLVKSKKKMLESRQ
jgi:hypothetical protein